MKKEYKKPLIIAVMNGEITTFTSVFIVLNSNKFLKVKQT
ncbi:hypothetical protein T256_00530 [Pediococcus pentosaceus SL4]|nr:hypothetical protein T256_00530 [Pediococcus pentosaceus SL4]